jgi:hypothetical protein
MNLFDALKQSRKPTTYARMWIDALCMDQSNTEEKNLQVPMMGKIYSKSAQTVAWLGKEQDDTYLAFDLFEKLAAARRRLFTHTQITDGDQDISSIFDLISGYLDEKYLHAARNFFLLPYWNRIWVVQEAIMGTWTAFRCRRHELLLADLEVAQLFMNILLRPRNAKYFTGRQRVMIQHCGFSNSFMPLMGHQRAL